QLQSQWCALDPNTGDIQQGMRCMAEAHTAEINWQVVLQIAQHDLQNAVWILPVADGARGAIEQRQLFELSAQPCVGLFALRDVADECTEGELLARAQWCYGQLDGKLAAVAAQRRDLDPAVQDRAYAACQITPHPALMCFAIALGNDHPGKLLPDGLSAGPAE